MALEAAAREHDYVESLENWCTFHGALDVVLRVFVFLPFAFLVPLAYVVGMPVIIALNGVSQLGDRLNVLMICVSLVCTIAPSVVRLASFVDGSYLNKHFFFLFYSPSLEPHENNVRLLKLFLGTFPLSLVIMFPWTIVLPHGGGLVSINGNYTIIVSVLSILLSSSLIWNECNISLRILDETESLEKPDDEADEILKTNHKERRLSKSSIEYVKIRKEGNQIQETKMVASEADDPSETWKCVRIRSNEGLIMRVNEEQSIWAFKKLVSSIALNIRNYIKLQLYFYAVDFCTSAAVMVYLLVTQTPFNIITIQLSTLGMIPFAVCILNIVFFNRYMAAFEERYTVKTNAKIGYGFVSLCNRSTTPEIPFVGHVPIRDILYYEPDVKALITIAMQVVVFVLKNFVL